MVLRRRRAGLVEPGLCASAQNRESLGEQGGGVFVSSVHLGVPTRVGSAPVPPKGLGEGKRINQEREAQECCLLRNLQNQPQPEQRLEEEQGILLSHACLQPALQTPVSATFLSQPPVNRPT